MFFQNPQLSNVLSPHQIEKVLGEPDKNKLKQLIKTGIGKFSRVVEELQVHDRQLAKSMLLLHVKIILSHNVENLFHYWRGLEKFDWKTLEFNYENMSYRSLVEIINYSSAETCP